MMGNCQILYLLQKVNFKCYQIIVLYHSFIYIVLGVFQTLVEKHFPAPDRNRIQRLLGLEPPTNSKPSTNGNSDGNNSSNKRKPSGFIFIFILSYNKNCFIKKSK